MTTADQSTEAAIVAAGATKGPRVTPADIEAEIASVHFFIASDAIQHEHSVHEHKGGWYLGSTQLLTFCVIQLRNGFTVTGESACASPENFNAEIGRRIARENAVAKVWPLMGYELRSKMALIEASQAPTMPDSDVKTYVGTKVVHACPMTRAAYNKLRGWDLPANEDGDDEGYLVEYADGGTPNMAPFKGYVSWSPRDVFDRAYTVGVAANRPC